MSLVMRCVVLLVAMLVGPVLAEQRGLARVSGFDTVATGFAGTKSDNYKTFEAELARGAKAAPVFEKALKEGTPAARLYAAVGLFKLDEGRGKAALESLRSDGARVWSTEGCDREETTVGAMATRLLKNAPQAMGAYSP